MQAISARYVLAYSGLLALLFVLSCAGGMTGSVLLWFGLEELAKAGEAEPAPAVPVYPREEFTRLVRDRTGQEVIYAVGRPDSTSKDSDVEYWHYRRRTRDPITDRIDTDAQVVFRDGKVREVTY